MTKWEYLEITGNIYTDRWEGWKTYFHLNGKEIQEFFKTRKAYKIWVWKDSAEKRELQHATQTIRDRLNELGQDGWENYAIVSNIEAGMYASYTGDWTYYFKRPVSS